MAAASNHVRVRAKALAPREQRSSERAASDAMGHSRDGAQPSYLLGYSSAHRSCARQFWCQEVIFSVLDISCSSYARASAGARRSVGVVSDASDARVVLLSRTRGVVY